MLGSNLNGSMALRLPTEVLVEIFKYVSLLERVRTLELVCKSWREVLLGSPQLWSVIDLRNIPRRSNGAGAARLETVKSLFRYARGQISEVYLANVDMIDRFRCEFFVIEQAPKCLRILHIHDDTGLFSMSSSFTDRTWSMLENLVDLRIPLKNSTALISLFARGRLPSLVNLTCYRSAERIFRCLVYDIPAKHSPLRRKLHLKSLDLGSYDEDSITYINNCNGDGGPAWVLAEVGFNGLNQLFELLPDLQILSLRYIRINTMLDPAVAANGELFFAQESVLDLTSNSALTRLYIEHSHLGAQPLVDQHCKIEEI
ncbi:hypothetical protein V1511DRAFT_501464 [Dipodascopsis uninucleata]